MRVLFVLPPSKFALKEAAGITALPLGLAYLASVLEREGHKVKVLDCPTLEYDLKDLEREIKGFRPQVMGITSTTSTIYDAYKVARLTKEINPKAVVVIGGPHVSFTAEQTLRECPFIDVVVRGEGETTTEELITCLEEGQPLEEVRGISFRKDEKVVETENRPFIENLDELPFPAYHLLPMDRYKVGRHHFANIITSRGCPFSCIFCSSSQLCGKRWRARSPENVIEELKVLKYEYNISEVEFLDDTFTLNSPRAEKICDLMMRENLNLSWSASSRVNTLTQRLANKMRKAGCHTIYLGIESGSQKILDLIQKGTNLVQAERAVEILKGAKINVLGSFIIGIPGETIKSIKKTIKFAKKLNLNFAQFSICTPYPGTKLFDIARERGFLLTRDWSKYTILDPVMKTPGILSKELKRWLLKAYLSFYLRPKFLLEQVKRRDLFFFRKALKAGLNYIRG
ncbi:B12-binding domain-containing radical SAM protein [Candidatus Aerophobetes bacterium]|uniref:B12-binding domain-containing radical SAM protein n=1 Tax=Aerophobetes bacterium TaxID=2030807 RepID=A0A497E4A2_UNCAE|nr:MAG: B12-binding domain-containing radical SAM protein [Candidatus Aerophobetes bacterium]